MRARLPKRYLVTAIATVASVATLAMISSASANPVFPSVMICDGLTGCYIGGALVDCRWESSFDGSIPRIDGPVRCSRPGGLTGIVDSTIVLEDLECFIYGRAGTGDPHDVVLVYYSDQGAGVIRKDFSMTATCARNQLTP